MEALGENEPRLALQMTFRLAYLLVFSEDGEVLADLMRRAEGLEQRLGDAEARVLAGFTEQVAKVGRAPGRPLEAPRFFEDMERSLDLLEPAEECGREDLLFRVLQWAAAVHYAMARISECEQTIERAAEIAERLGSPRFSWEVDLNRGLRRFDRGDREGAEALIRRAGAVVRRVRPDLHIFLELTWLVIVEWVYGGENAMLRLVYETMNEEMPRGIVSAGIVSAAAEEGDQAEARSRLHALLTGDLEQLRRPDAHLPMALCVLAYAAYLSGDREAGARLRPLLEPLRNHLVTAVPAIGCGLSPEWAIGILELVAERPADAVRELGDAVERTDRADMAWASAWYRCDLAAALHRNGETERAQAMLAEGESLAKRYGVGWAVRRAAEVRAELEGREPPSAHAVRGRSRPIRVLAARGGRRALAAMVSDLSDAEIERRFADPRRQRSLMRALARAFQPAQARGFSGVVAYELEPFAIEPPPDSPWRWALEVDSRAGRARLREPAPLDAAVTIHLGLADWVRAIAGKQSALAAIVGGRCSVEGDVLVAARLEAMFGGR
jgi:tetratricopeptide (TPR) repeat protein